MKAKEVNETIEKLDDQDWENMKKHLDEKFPTMTLPTVEDFKALVKLYGKFQTYKEDDDQGNTAIITEERMNEKN